MIASASGGFAGKTGIAVEILGVDATAKAFRAVSARAAGLGQISGGFAASLKTFGAIGAALAGLGVAAKKAADAFRELGDLSDRASDAGIAAPMLQKLVGAMQQFGVRGADIDTVSRAMQNMARTTGEVGAEGFAKVLGQAAQLGTEAERLEFLAKAFGRTQGAVFASVVRDGGDSLDALLDLAAGYPAVSDAAVQGGDRAADAMALASAAISAGWQQMCGELVLHFEQLFGPLPEVAQNVSDFILRSFRAVADSVRFIVYFIRAPLDAVVRSVIVAADAVGRLYDAATTRGYSFAEAFADIRSNAADFFDEFVERRKEEFGSLFDFSDIGARAETAPVFDAMREAAAQGGVTFRKEAEKTKIEKPTRDKGPSFAQAMGFGSAEVSKLLFGNRTQDIQARALGEARRTNDYLARIDASLAGLEAV